MEQRAPDDPVSRGGFGAQAAEIVSDVSQRKYVSQCHTGPLRWELSTHLPSTSLLTSL